MFPKNIIKPVHVFRHSGNFSYKEVCKKVGSDKFFVSDRRKKSFYSIVKNEQEYENLVKENKGGMYFLVYKYISGKKISLTVKQCAGIIGDKNINEIQQKLNKLVIGALHRKIMDIVFKVARFLYDDQTIHSCEFKIKFIIASDYKVYVYKIYTTD